MTGLPLWWGLRGGRCQPCNVAWAWKPSPVAPVAGAHCPRCGESLSPTTLANIRRFPIRLGFPWYRSEIPPRGIRTRYEPGADMRHRHAKRYGGYLRARAWAATLTGFWFTFDAGRGTETRQEGRRLVRQWAPADLPAPGWLDPVPEDDPPAVGAEGRVRA